MHLTETQRAAVIALGLNPDIVVGPVFAADDPRPPLQRRWLAPDKFSDEEWQMVLATGALPLEAPQAASMSLRTLTGAVTAVICGARSWTDLGPEICGEPVRKRFSRLAALGVWQKLATALQADKSVPDAMQVKFAAVANRAATLRLNQR